MSLQDWAAETTWIPVGQTGTMPHMTTFVEQFKDQVLGWLKENHKDLLP